MKPSIQVRVLKSFRNPLTNRMAKVGEDMKVPHDNFWLRRLRDLDCEKTKKASKPKPVDKPAKNGSKKL